tara:strand:+ start:1021 stop:1284 length:264 start_codon:yes stop_codon:yes gene_type:complete
MAFTERQEFKLEIIPPHYVIQCRRADIVEKDGVEVGRQFVRMLHAPGDDLTMACSEAQAVANVLWTDEVIAAYQATLESQPEPEPEA